MDACTMHKKIFLFAIIILIISIPLASGYSVNSPKEQFSKGIDPHDVQCKPDRELIFKKTNFEPTCVKSTSIQKLIERGWASDHDPHHMDMMK